MVFSLLDPDLDSIIPDSGDGDETENILNSEQPVYKCTLNVRYSNKPGSSTSQRRLQPEETGQDWFKKEKLAFLVKQADNELRKNNNENDALLYDAQT